MTDVYRESLALHKKYQGKIKIESVIPINNRKDLAVVYTPGVAEPCRKIAANPALSYDLTWRGRTVAVISDGSAVLGLGNIGPEAAIPVMEGKAILLKKFGGVDAVPIVVNTQNSAEIVSFVRQIAPSFAGINLEDISAPRCFQIEEELQNIGIPVFHDDQHGTAIVVKAALVNAAKVVGKPYESLNVVIIGAGAAGLAVAKMLLGISCLANVCQKIPRHPAVGSLIMVDRKGAIYAGRTDQNVYKQAIAGVSNLKKRQGAIGETIKGADVVIGLSAPNLITGAMVRSMAKNPIVFSLANPTPEIMPDVAKKAGAAVVASGRSDFANQINNVLVFPGIFQAVIKGRLTTITQEMKLAASEALSNLVKKPSPAAIIPDPFTPHLADYVARAVLADK